MKFGLKKDTIDKINNVFTSFPAINEVILYGSRAKGNFREGSDIDLTLKGSSISLNMLYSIASQLDELNMPYRVDLSIYSNIDNQELKEHIDRVGISIYHAKNVAA